LPESGGASGDGGAEPLTQDAAFCEPDAQDAATCAAENATVAITMSNKAARRMLLWDMKRLP
jgi:hypothetical protein